jgi:radical SAM superfamily enzyme YgiQ (UPF0313 family)
VIEKNGSVRPPLGMLAVMGAIQNHDGVTSELIDCPAQNIDKDEFSEIISAKQPDMLAFSAVTFNLVDCIKAARIAKGVSADTKICFGGYHPSLYPRETLAVPGVDFVVYGEGERTFAELIEATSQNASDLGHINGLAWKTESGELRVNAPRPVERNLDTLPLPAWNLLDLQRYVVPRSESLGVAAVQASRGCFGNCLFCDMRGTGVRHRSPDHIMKELELLKGMGVDEFFFVDDTFTASKKRVLALCEKMVGLNMRYKINARVDCVDTDILSALKNSGCHAVHYGVESGSQRILDYLRKNITLDQVRNAFDMTKQAGMTTSAFMMFGVPGETVEEMQQSIKFVGEIEPDNINYSICLPLPKTALTEQAIEKGTIDHDFWQDFAKDPVNTPVVIPTINEYLNAEELRGLQDSAMEHFYSQKSI